MGRDITGLRIDKKLNAKPTVATRDRVHLSPKISNGKAEQEEKVVGDHDAKAVIEGSQEKQDVLTVKSTNTKADSSPVKLSSETDAKGSPPTLHSLQSSKVSTENRVPRTSIANKVETTAASISPSKMNGIHTPVTARRSQPHSLLMSGKYLQTDRKKYLDEEDTYSITSSVATSVRTVRSKVTVPMEPTFRSSERLNRRKEYYTKLEEKHKALKAEKLEYVARSKEEEEAAIKQLRKTMTYRANPVPNFYREGPAPKVEIKKLPVTRAKSPNFTRRKSCGDAVKSSPNEKKSIARPTRHSIGVHRNGIASPTTPKNKDLSTTRNAKGPTKLKGSNGSSNDKARPKQAKETAITPPFESEQMSPGIPAAVETNTSHVSEQSPDPAVVEYEIKNAAKDADMNSQTMIEA